MNHDFVRFDRRENIMQPNAPAGNGLAFHENGNGTGG